MKQYNYGDLQTYIVGPNINRHNFSTMPAIMRVAWDAYWLAMDMPNSLSARRATAQTKQLFLTHKTSPTTEHLVDSLTAYSTLKRHQPLIGAAAQLLEHNQCKAKISDAHAHKLYNGQWIAEFEEKLREKDLSKAGPSNT